MSVRAAIAFCLVGIVILPACTESSPPPQSPPSLAGTWSRGNDRLTSLLAFFDGGDGLAFRWIRQAADGKRRTECDWDGLCIEMLDGQQVGEYRCTLLPGAGPDRASVSCVGWLDEGERLDMSWTDDFELEPGGRALRCYSREANGLRYTGDARPLRVFTKVSRSVADPPRKRPS